MLGAIVGAEIGSRIDEADKACIAHGLELAADRQRVQWEAPGGLRYTLTPLGAYQGEAACRVFSLDVSGGRNQNARGVGCRQPDGSWRLRGL